MTHCNGNMSHKCFILYCKICMKDYDDVIFAGICTKQACSFTSGGHYVVRDISVSPQCFIYNRMLTAEPKMMLLKRFSLGLQNMKCPLQPSVVKMAGRGWASMLPGWKLTGRLTESSTSTFPLWRILFHSRPRVCCHYPAAYKPKCCLSCLSSIVLPAVVPFSAPVLWNVSRSI